MNTINISLTTHEISMILKSLEHIVGLGVYNSDIKKLLDKLSQAIN